MVGESILWLDSCPSTNDEATKYVHDRTYTTVVSNHQSSGRGRMGRAWHSPAGCGLYLSHIIYPQCPQSMGGAIPLMAGIAVAETCANLGVSVQLKWPNDVLIGTRKLAGILCEAQGLPGRWNAIVGIGLNLKTPNTGWPPGVPAVALDAVSDRILESKTIAKDLVRRLNDGLARLENEGTAPIIRDWLNRGVPIGTRLRRGNVEGTFAGLTPDGALRIQMATGIEIIHAGDVDVVHGD